MKRKAKTVLGLLILSVLVLSGGTAGNKISVQAETKKSIDFYLIAGQSNAAGYSEWDKISAADMKSKYTSGYENIYFYGRADMKYTTNFSTRVKTGLGISQDRFGAELGIADVLSESNTTGEAMIVKYACGGTYLTDNLGSRSERYGNWCPPSMTRKDLKISGKLYDEFIDTFLKATKHYTELGYKVNLKGTFWMQGEAECDGTYSSANYKGHLTTLIDDLRKDYVKILNDEKAAEAPFVIGKICPTFAGGNSAVDAVRQIQEDVAAVTPRVYLAETSDYVMVDENGRWTNGFDPYHFTGNDMLSLGKRVGNIFVEANKPLEANEPHVAVKVEGNGKADRELVVLTGEPTAITFTPTKEHYVLNKVIYDDEDVTDKVINGKYTVTDTQGFHRLVAIFKEEEKYNFTIDSDHKQVSI